MFGFGKRSVEAMAREVEALGYSVDVNYDEPTVKIIRRADRKEMSVLEGDAAQEFIDNADDLARSVGADTATALLAEAKLYVESYEALED